MWSLQRADSRQREAGELEHRPEAVEAWVGELCRRFGYGDREERRKLVEEKTAQLNRLIGILKGVFSADIGVVCEVGQQAGVRFFGALAIVGGVAKL